MKLRSMQAALAMSAATVFVLVSHASGAAIHGTCDALDQLQGQIYPPLMNATSGMVGTVKPAGTVGATVDTVRLGYLGSTMVGKANWLWDYNVGTSLRAGFAMDPNSLTLRLNLYDVDFKPVVTAGFSYHEELELTFVPNVADKPGPVDLVVNDTNYGNYRLDGFGATDNAFTSYVFNLKTDLGLTDQQLADVAAGQEFGIYATEAGRLTHLRVGSEDFTQSNKDGVDDNHLEFTLLALPEPATLVLLAAGAVSLWRRR